MAGTTGYDFLQKCDDLYVPADGLRQITRDYGRLVGQSTSFDEVARVSKLLMLRVAMAGELQMLAHRLSHISEQQRRTRDFTLNMLRFALREIFDLLSGLSHLSGAGRRLRARSTRRVAGFAQANAVIRPWTAACLTSFARCCCWNIRQDSAAHRREREVFAGRFQQVTSPIMAKGVEDTAFYNYVPLLSLNEVGNRPDTTPVTVDLFHAWNQERARRRCHAMLASSTHDTNRSA